jgi:hypothetical protein
MKNVLSELFTIVASGRIDENITVYEISVGFEIDV